MPPARCRRPTALEAAPLYALLPYTGAPTCGAPGRRLLAAWPRGGSRTCGSTIPSGDRARQSTLSPLALPFLGKGRTRAATRDTGSHRLALAAGSKGAPPAAPTAARGLATPRRHFSSVLRQRTGRRASMRAARAKSGCGGDESRGRDEVLGGVKETARRRGLRLPPGRLHGLSSSPGAEKTSVSTARWPARRSIGNLGTGRRVQGRSHGIHGLCIALLAITSRRSLARESTWLRSLASDTFAGVAWRGVCARRAPASARADRRGLDAGPNPAGPNGAGPIQPGSSKRRTKVDAGRR